MKKLFVSLMMLLASWTVAGTASAVVVSGSSYSLYLQGETSGNATLPTTVFDDEASLFDRAGLILTLSESETLLGNGNSRITLNLSADGDLFPVLGEGAFFGVGTFGDVIDLETAVFLYDARVTLRDLSGTVLLASDNLANFAVNNPPWDGSFPTADTTFRIGEIGGQNVASVSFDFFVTEQIPSDVPEPGSVLLCGIGLLAAFGVLRYRRKS